MVKPSLISSIKKTCLGIGLRKKDDNIPLEIHGTGFFVKPEGYIITANHVISALNKRCTELNSSGEEVELAGFYLFEKDEPQLLSWAIPHTRRIVLNIPSLKDYLPQDHDISICRLYGKGIRMPFLELKKSKMNVYEEIFMCGYAGGDFSLNIFDKKAGQRISPILQTGRISSLMPTDNAKYPFGIQTDIIGTGGSSGSPIIDANDGKAVAIAQQVIPSIVADWDKKPLGYTNTGLTWGVSFFFLYEGIFKMIEEMKKVEDDSGVPTVERPHAIWTDVNIELKWAYTLQGEKSNEYA